MKLLRLFGKKSIPEIAETGITNNLLRIKNLVYNNLAERVITHIDYIMIATITFYITRCLYNSEFI